MPSFLPIEDFNQISSVWAMWRYWQDMLGFEISKNTLKISKCFLPFLAVFLDGPIYINGVYSNQYWRARGELFSLVGSSTLVAYLRPLTVAPVCINCHVPKKTMTPEVKRILTKRCPEDRATGFRDGDLRSEISVKILLKPEQPR
jgi:hypothetical protein